MKKRIALVFAVLCLILCGCNNSAAEAGSDPDFLEYENCVPVIARDGYWEFDLGFGMLEKPMTVTGLRLEQKQGDRWTIREYTLEEIHGLGIDVYPANEPFEWTLQFPADEETEGYAFYFSFDDNTAIALFFRVEAPVEVPETVGMDSGWDQRLLSDEEIRDLAALPVMGSSENGAVSPAEAAREKISTTADAYYYLACRCSMLADDSSMVWEDGTRSYSDPIDILNTMGEICPGKQDIANILLWLLEDDLPIGMIFGIHCRTAYDNNGPFNCVDVPSAVNYVRTEEDYAVFDPVQGLAKAAKRTACTFLPEGSFETLEDYGRYAKEKVVGLWKLCAWTGSGQMDMAVQQEEPRVLEIMHTQAQVIFYDPELDQGLAPYDPSYKLDVPDYGFYDSQEFLSGKTAPAQVEKNGDWNRRLLSDEELRELAQQCKDNVKNSLTEQNRFLRERISTVPDAIYLLDHIEEWLYMDSRGYTHSEGNAGYTYPIYVLGRDQRGEVPPGRQDIANIMMWLLEDDIPIGMVYGVCIDEAEYEGQLTPAAAANYVVTDGGYMIFDAVQGMAADQGSRDYMEDNVLPQWSCKTLEEYGRFAKAAKPNLWKLVAWSGSGGVEIKVSNNPRTLEVLNRDAQVIFHDPELDHNWPGCGPEDIDRYRLTKVLGGLTLTVEEAKALADAEPEEVQEKVKTAADVLLYMLAAGITDSFGDEYFWVWPEWHYNRSAQQVMASRTGNCGSCASLANYLLDGDYEEVGYINQVYSLGGGGGHVYNYIKYEGKYYIVDYSSYVYADYAPEWEHEILSVSRLEDYGSRTRELYAGDAPVTMVMAYDSPARDYPCVFGGDNVYYWPEGAEFTWLYREEGSHAYGFGTLPLPDYVPSWRGEE